jgi:hypothetical protein
MLDTFQKFVTWASTLSLTPKILLSCAVVILAGLTLSVVWTPAKNAPGDDPITVNSMWPDTKTVEALRRRLDRLSETNANMLKIIANKQRAGAYVFELVDAMKITRGETVLRTKELEKDGLIELVPLTDVRAQMNEDVVRLLGDGTASFISGYWK